MKIKNILCVLGLIVSNNVFAESLSTYLNKVADTSMIKLQKGNEPVTAVSITAQCANGLPVNIVRGSYSKSISNPISKDSIFQIGSITKSFISVVILQLSSEYKFTLDDKIGKWFPEYPEWKNVTIRQLMSMTSGIPSYIEDDEFFYKFNLKKYVSPDDMLNMVKNKPLQFKSGSKFYYSNTNYILLGKLIQKITGNSTDSEINKRIIKKLNLKNTYFVNNIPSEVVESAQLVYGYNYDKGLMTILGSEIPPSYSLSWANASGGMISTPSDINLYIHSLYDQKTLLTKSQFQQFVHLTSTLSGQQITTLNPKDKSGYGLGIFGNYEDKKNSLIYNYAGGVFGFTFTYFYDPKTNTSIVIAINKHGQALDNYDLWPILKSVKSICAKSDSN